MTDAAKPKTKKVAAPKKPADHPKYIDMIAAAIEDLKERSGSSRQAILKYIKANYKVGDSCEIHLKMGLKRGVASGKLLQPKGTGASGSFKNAKPVKAPVVPKKKPAAKPKKPAAKPKKTPKKTGAKKSKTKKPTKKPATKKAGTPKKSAAKKPTKKPAKKTPKPAKKSPKKQTKKPGKKPAKK